MKLTEQQQKAQEFLSSIYTKAWEDKTFKQELVDNPIEALNKFTGKVANFPEDKQVVVQDQTNPNNIYINIPVKPNLDDVELSEEQLEAVAGGVQDPLSWIFENVSLPIALWILGE